MVERVVRLRRARAPSFASSSSGTLMETVLIALAGCTGMDVVGVLEKMRAPLDGLTVRVTGERAVRLSQEKYCPVAAMLRPTVELTHEIVLADAEGPRRAAPAG
jgi:putative redox protein